MKRIIALVDCDSFFVSCEQVVAPELAGKAVCVIGSTDGCVLSRSKEAKLTGIKVGMPYFMAKKEFKDIIYVCANMELYQQISNKVMNCLKNYSPDIEICSIDEAFIDLTGTKKLYKKNYIDIIKMIKSEVKEKTGISVSIGLSTSKVLSKLASDKAKNTDGIFVISHSKINEILENTKIEEIWGIGRHNTKTLKQNGILDAKTFVNREDNWIKSQLGITGIKLKHELLGECISPVDSTEKPPQSIQKTAALHEFSSDKTLLKRHLKKHVRSACLKLRRLGGFCSCIGVMLRTKDFFVTYTKKPIANPTNFELEITKIAYSLLDEIYSSEKTYRSTGIVLEKLSYSQGRQVSLFEDEKLKKNESLASTLDKIEEKFGKNAIQIGF